MISVAGHPWVNDVDDFYIRSARLEGYEGIKVQELIVQDSGVWDVEQLQHFLSLKDVRMVLKTPLPPVGPLNRF